MEWEVLLEVNPTNFIIPKTRGKSLQFCICSLSHLDKVWYLGLRELGAEPRKVSYFHLRMSSDYLAKFYLFMMVCFLSSWYLFLNSLSNSKDVVPLHFFLVASVVNSINTIVRQPFLLIFFLSYVSPLILCLHVTIMFSSSFESHFCDWRIGIRVYLLLSKYSEMNEHSLLWSLQVLQWAEMIIPQAPAHFLSLHPTL